MKILITSVLQLVKISYQEFVTMKKKIHNKITGKTAAILFVILASTSVLFSCKDDNCDGKKCRTELGFNESRKERDAMFDSINPLTATKFNVYIENSLSMDPYVSHSNSMFKVTNYRLINQVVTDVLFDEDSLSLNYINSEPKEYEGTLKKFTDSFSPATFAQAGGNRATSDIIEIISNVVKSTKRGELSMFVSDCVYSPESSDDIDKALKKQQTDMFNILKRKARTDSTFGVLVYRFVSDFEGIYYNKTDAHIKCAKGAKRPYFVWYFGDESILANVRQSVSKIVEEQGAEYYGAFPGYRYVPYKTIGESHAYHYLNKKAGEDSVYKFSFYASLGRLPVAPEYIMNDSNYTCGKEFYHIKKIEPVDPTDTKGKGYDYKYTMNIRGGRNKMISPALVELSLDSQRGELPAWVNEFDDPTGEDYDNGYKSNLLRTFGLKSLIEGIMDFYNEPYYVTFRMKIN